MTAVPLPHSIEAVSFDAGGTLMVPWPSVGEVYAEVLAQEGFEADAAILEERFQSVFARQSEEAAPGEREAGLVDRAFWQRVVVKTLSGIVDPPSFESVFEELWNTFGTARRWKLCPGIEDALERLRQRGLPLVVTSNNDARLRGVLEEFGLLGLFRGVVLSAEVRAAKPDGRIFDAAAQAAGVPLDRILHLGDDWQRDVAAPRSMGMAALWYHPQGTGPRVPGELRHWRELIPGE